MSQQDPEDVVVSPINDIATVTTSLSEDLSELRCVLSDKNGHEVKFSTNLPTGPHVRAIIQTIEFTPNSAARDQEEMRHQISPQVGNNIIF